MGKAKVLVTAEAIAEMFKRNDDIPKYIEVEEGLPSDAEFIRMYEAEQGGRFWFVFESDGYEGRMEGDPIPEVEVKFLSHAQEQFKRR